MIAEFKIATPSTRFARRPAFSLVEVVLALGVVGLCLLPVVGLLPIGLKTQQAANENARAVSAMNMAATAAQSLRYYTPQQAQPTWAFPLYFSDISDPAANPTLVWVSQNPWHHVFFIDETGAIIPSTDNTTPRKEILSVDVYPPVNVYQPVTIYAAVAWPVLPTDTGGRDQIATPISQLAGRQVFIDTTFTFKPRLQYQ